MKKLLSAQTTSEIQNAVQNLSSVGIPNETQAGDEVNLTEQILRAEVEMTIAKAVDRDLIPQLLNIAGKKAELEGTMLMAGTEPLPLLTTLTLNGREVNIGLLKEKIIEAAFQAMATDDDIKFDSPELISPSSYSDKFKFAKEKSKILKFPVAKAILEVLGSLEDDKEISAQEIADELGISLDKFFAAFKEIKWRLKDLFGVGNPYMLDVTYKNTQIFQTGNGLQITTIVPEDSADARYRLRKIAE